MNGYEKLDYFNNSQSHQSLDDNTQVPREMEPPDRGKVIILPQVGGLHMDTQVTA